jgi:predicted enzyme related to lactoylglutathione lyase
MMNAVAVWFELPTTDLQRAETFYRAVFGFPLRRETSCDGSLLMSVFDVPDTEFKGALVKGEHFTPGLNGALVYLNAGRDLSEPLSRVEGAGGRVVMPKTAIGQYGYIAMFLDSEGNRVGLHSQE